MNITTRKQADDRPRAYRFWQTVLRWVFRLLFRVKAEGIENIPLTGGVIIAPNHASYFDPPIVGVFMPRMVNFFAKKELMKNPVARYFLTVSGSIPVDRFGFNTSAVREVIRRLDEGYGVCLFPEGTRTRDGRFRAPKAGAGMAAVMAGVPVVPCWIEGSYQARPFRSRITLHFMPPFHPGEIEADTKKEHYLLVSERIMCDIDKMYKKHHGRA